MHLSYLTPSKRTYALGILTVTAGMLLSCNTTPMTAMTEEGDSFRTQDMFHDGMVILESVPSGEGSIREVPGEVVIAGTADGSRIDAYPDSISPSELASIERRVSLDAAESVWTDPVRDNPRAAIQEDLPHPDRGPQSDLIKLSAVGASAFALGGYVNQSFFNQQREEEAQTAREGATIRIRQLEEQLAAAEAAKRLQTAVDLYSQPAAEAEGLQTAVDFYNHTATLNNNTRCQLPDFFNQSCLLSANPGWMKAAPLGMSAFLVGGYVAQKVRRSYKEVENRLAKSEEEKQAFQGQLKSEKEVRVQAEKKRLEVQGQLAASKTNANNLQGQLAASIAEREVVQGQLETSTTNADNLQGQLAASTTNADNLQGQLAASIAEREVVQEQFETSTTNANNLQGQLRTAEANGRQLEEDLTAVGGLRTRTITNIEAPDENGRTPLILAVQQQNEPLVRMLLNKGANVATAMQNSGSNICADQSGYTAFHAAVDTKNLPIFHMLIEAVTQEAQQALKDHHMRLLMKSGEILRCNIVRYIELDHLVATNPVLRAKLHMMATVLREEFNIHGLV